MRISAKFAASAAFVTLVVAFNGCSAQDAGRPSGKAAKDFTLTALDGRAVTLSQYAGKSNVLIHFGTTWCPPCVGEIPALKALHSQYGPERLAILYVDSNEGREIVEAFVKKHGIEYPTLMDADGAVANLYGINAIPQNILVDKEGRIVAWSIEIPEKEIESLLGG